MLELSSGTNFALVIALLITILFSFVPERFIKPEAPKLSLKTIIIQSLLVSILFLCVSLIVQRAVFSSLAVSIFLIILSGVSNAKFTALREPMVFSDFMMFSQAFRHPRLYFPFLGLLPVILMPLIIITLIYAVMTLEPAIAITPTRIISSIVVILAAFFLAKKLALSLNLSQEPAVDNARHGLLNSLFAYAIQAQTETHKETVTNILNQSLFAVNSSKNINKMTPPHLCEVFAKPHSSSSRRSAPTLSRQSLGSGGLQNNAQNITVIQSESFFDARRLDSSIKSSVLENYDRCKTDSVQYGKLNVPAWGANTMRTEFSFLTGLKYEDMGFYRYYPYQYLHQLPVTSLATYLKSQGYYCVCIHPHPASFFGRDRIFPKLGFDEFIDIQSFDIDDTFGPYISDQAVTEKIIETTHENTGKPLFIFAITMENHGPLHLEKTTQDEQKHYFDKAPIDKPNDLTVYLRHLNNADKMIDTLTKAYRQIDKASTLCFYGDHIPSIPEIYQQLDYNDEDSDYFIWQNTGSQNENSCMAKELPLSADALAETLLMITGNI